MLRGVARNQRLTDKQNYFAKREIGGGGGGGKKKGGPVRAANISKHANHSAH